MNLEISDPDSKLVCIPAPLNDMNRIDNSCLRELPTDPMDLDMEPSGVETETIDEHVLVDPAAHMGSNGRVVKTHTRQSQQGPIVSAKLKLDTTVTTHSREGRELLRSINTKFELHRAEGQDGILGIARGRELFWQVNAPRSLTRPHDFAISDRREPIRGLETPPFVAMEDHQLGTISVWQG